MNIIKENVDALNAVIKIKVEPTDYQNKVDDAIKSVQKRAQLPGFRPGKVPSGLVKKMYGKNILVDELNKLLNETVHKYIIDSNIEILGSPMPKLNENSTVDWDNQKDFEFSYDIGLAPQFNIELSSKDKFTYHVVKIEDKMLNDQIDMIARRHGTVINPDTAEMGDFLVLDFVELENNEIKQGGIFKSSMVFTEKIKDAELQKQISGAKVGDKFTTDIHKLSDNIIDKAAMLGVDKSVAEKITNPFQLTIKTISRMKKADIDQALFDRIYGAGVVNSMDEFKAKVSEELARNYTNESDRKLYNDIVDSLMKKANFQLPDEFLKRWIVSVNEKPISYDQVDAEYDRYVQGLKWQLIENKIIKDNQITVTNDEAVDYTKRLMLDQYARYGQNIDEKTLTDSANKVLSDEKEGKRIFDILYGNKVMELFKTKFTLEKKELSIDEFVKLNNPTK